MRIIQVVIAGCSFAAFITGLHAESTGEAFQRLARGISYLTYGDVLWQRTPSYFKDDPDLKTSWENYQQAMAVMTDLAELKILASHPDSKVRTLAMMRLYNMEEPEAFRVIYGRVSDDAETFPSRSFLTQISGTDRMQLESKPCTVAKVANLMLEQAGFPLRWLGDPATGGSIEEWTGWYEYLYRRATGRTSPIPKNRVPKMAAVRRKIDALPPVTRAWMLLAVGTIDLDINEGRDPRVHIPLFATEEDLIAAAKQLGPDALLAFLRDGTRTGLRDPKGDDASKGRGFIIANAGDLFRKEDADVLMAMDLLVAAADANPELASDRIRQALAGWETDKSIYYDQRGDALAALLDLCGDRESDFVVRTFYEEPWATARSNAEDAFIRELGRRKPKEWKKTIRGLVGHREFERLNDGTVFGLARMVGILEGGDIVNWNPTRGTIYVTAVRNTLRQHFGLPLVTYRPLEERIESVKPPVLTVKLPIAPEFFELSPDGAILAAVPREGHLALFSTTDGKALGTLASQGEVRALHFGRSDGRLMTLNRERLLQTWDIATANEISRTQSDTLAIYYDAIFSSSGEFLVSSPHQGYAVIDLASLKPRSQIEMRTRGNGMFRLSPDDQQLAINDGFGKTIRFFDIGSAKPFATLEGHADVPLSAAFSPDGEIFVSWANDGKIMFWNGKTGAFLREFTHSSGLFPWLVFTADSKHTLCSTKQRQFAKFDVQTGIATHAFAHSPELGRMDRIRPTPPRISMDGKKLVGLTQVSTGKRDQFETYLECWDLSQ